MREAPVYRCYIDEVGNTDLKASSDPNHRYLSLTGVIIGLDHVRTDLSPRLEKLKKDFFEYHPDEPIVLHRKELLNGKPPFRALLKPEVRALFDEEMFTMLVESEYTVITAVIDKLEFLNRYQGWREDPYHYCLEVVMERYVQWLRGVGALGDAMAESRGGRDDIRLKQAFVDLYNRGTGFVHGSEFRAHLTSSQLKIKPKTFNVAGLQLADVVAHPSCRGVVERHNKHALAGGFGGRVARLLEQEKYRRSAGGRIDGYGTKWLP